jgi:transposase
VETCQQQKKRGRRGRPPKAEQPQEEVYYRLGVESAALERAQDEQGWFVLATTVGAEGCSDTEVLQAYQEQNTTGEPGFRWIKNPAAITPVWLEKPERIATLVMLTVLGLLGYALIQRQVRLSLRHHDQQLPGNKGATAIPTAAVVLSLFVQVMMVQLEVDKMVSLQVYGLQDHHLTVCDALGIDRLWYESPPTGQNRRMSATPP